MKCRNARQILIVEVLCMLPILALFLWRTTDLLIRFERKYDYCTECHAYNRRQTWKIVGIQFDGSGIEHNACSQWCVNHFPDHEHEWTHGRTCVKSGLWKQSIEIYDRETCMWFPLESEDQLRIYQGCSSPESLAEFRTRFREVGELYDFKHFQAGTKILCDIIEKASQPDLVADCSWWMTQSACCEEAFERVKEERAARETRGK